MGGVRGFGKFRAGREPDLRPRPAACKPPPRQYPAPCGALSLVLAGKLVPRRILSSLLVTVVLAMTPTLSYEALEKTAERVGPTGHWLTLSLRAERDTRWQPVTGVFAVDRALHEVDETLHFWRLVGGGTALVARDAAPPNAPAGGSTPVSTPPVATLVGR